MKTVITAIYAVTIETDAPRPSAEIQKAFDEQMDAMIGMCVGHVFHPESGNHLDDIDLTGFVRLG